MSTASPVTAPPQKIDRAGLAAAIAAISVAATGFGHSLPLFSILLKGYGASDIVIGLNTGVAALAAICAAPFFPRIIGRYGLQPFLLVCVIVMVVMYFGFYLAGSQIWLWYPLRFIFGLAGAGLFAGSEYWINALAPSHLRGKIIGIYGTFLALGFALGPLMIEVIGYQGVAPFIAGMVIFSLAAIPIMLVKSSPRPDRNTRHGFLRMIPKAPATFFSAAVFAATESSILIFLPVLTIDQGWGAETGARAITVYGFGILALQYLIGMAADRLGTMRILMICAVTSAMVAASFGFFSGTLMTMYIVLFVWGGLVAGIYTTGLIMTGERYPAKDLAAANTGLVFMYGVGAIIGPVSAGIVRNYYGPNGLSFLLTAGLVAYAILTIVRRRESLP